jgi:hypothetical protein
MPDFYFILFLKRLDADEKLQYFQLPYIPCRMVSGNEIKIFFHSMAILDFESVQKVTTLG